MKKFDKSRLSKQFSLQKIIMRKFSTNNLTLMKQGSGLNSDERFDNITRSIAGSLTRRDMLKVAMTGFLGIGLAKLGIRTAWAGDSCLCNGVKYDPDLSCCTSFGVIQKHPIADLTQCPNKVPHPTHTCVPNGCGGSGGISVPNGFGAANFLPACNDHDCCYDKCNSTKATCDTDFLTSLNDACSTAYPGNELLENMKRNMCLKTAKTYYNFVNSQGQTYFDAAQRQSCDCCASEPCAESCAGGACGNLPSCAANDPDCLCFTTPEGSGACIPGSTPCAGLKTCSSSSQCPPGYGCAVTSCCGNFGVCGPLCSDVKPAPLAMVIAPLSASVQQKSGGATMGGN